MDKRIVVAVVQEDVTKDFDRLVKLACSVCTMLREFLDMLRLDNLGGWREELEELAKEACNACVDCKYKIYAA